MGGAGFPYLGSEGYSKGIFIDKFLGVGVSGQRNR